MKRQRTDNDLDLSKHSFESVLQFLRQDPKLNFDQLDLLSSELGRLYRNEANLISQNFPSDLWQQIFKHMLGPNPTHWNKKTPQNIKYWLDCRTVSKTWCSSISKFDFSPCLFLVRHIGGMNLKGIMSLLTFSTLRIDCQRDDFDVAVLTKITELRLYRDAVIPLDQGPSISCLTQLNKLGFDGQYIPQESLLCLTNLKKLVLDRAPHITTLHTLTKLETLTFLEEKSPALTQEVVLRDLPRIQELECMDPSFFRTGKGKCNCPDWYYSGEWKEGKRHGFGVCDRGIFAGRYTGDWVEDKEHGTGTWTWPRTKPYSNFKGEFIAGCRTGKGVRTYSNGDIYDGQWVNGKRDGQGTYCSLWVGVYTGEWRNGVPEGMGRCSYIDGAIYDGEWEDGGRTGDGEYINFELELGVDRNHRFITVETDNEAATEDEDED